MANTTAACPKEETASWTMYMGVALCFVAQPGINIGQNIQADGLAMLPEDERLSSPYKSNLWTAGLIMFISFSLLNFAALSFAPASILLPLEVIQFVSNVGYASVVHHKEVPLLMRIGVVLALLGTACTVLFGSKESSCYTIASFEDPWEHSWSWWIYLGSSLGVAVVAGAVWWDYSQAVKEGGTPWMHEVVLPVTFTLVAALAGGALLIVNSKVFSESLSMIIRGDPGVLTSYAPYVGLVGAIVCGIVWVGALTVCLSMYDPLVILPLMVASFIVFGSVAGGVYFNEFGTIGFRLGSTPLASALGWLGYVGGMLLVLGGLYAIAVSGTAEQVAQAAQAPDAFAMPGERARKHWRRISLITKAGVRFRPNAAHLPYSHPLATVVQASARRLQLGSLSSLLEPPREKPTEVTPLHAPPAKP